MQHILPAKGKPEKEKMGMILLSKRRKATFNACIMKFSSLGITLMKLSGNLNTSLNVRALYRDPGEPLRFQKTLFMSPRGYAVRVLMNKIFLKFNIFMSAQKFC